MSRAILAGMKPFALLLLSCATAAADPQFYNATANNLTVEGTFPNGAVKKLLLSGGGPAPSDAMFSLTPNIKSIKVSVVDDTGTSVWTGTVGRADTYVIVPNGKGFRVEYSGVYGGEAGPDEAVFMNITGDPITLDLEGHNGVGASRGIVVGTSFDVKKPVRLDPKETAYSVVAKVKGNDKLDLESLVSPGHYYLVWKNSNGAIRAVGLGNIAVKKRK